MTNSSDSQIMLHTEAETLKDVIKRTESLILVSVDSIRHHAVPECQNVADVLETLIESLFIAGNSAEALQDVLYQDFLSNDGKSSVRFEVGKTALGGLKVVPSSVEGV